MPIRSPTVAHHSSLLFFSSNANQGKQLPDPVALVRRLAFLEAAIQRLGSDCTKITEQKRDFVVSLLALQVENVQLLREVCVV
jgi:hypothetical protein